MNDMPKPIPDGYTTVTPWIIGENTAGLMDFLARAFEAEDLGRMDVDGKIGHAEIVIGDSVVMLSDAVMEPARVSSIFLYVPNVDKTMAKAVKAGATVKMPVMDQFWGDRFGSLFDPQGNIWSIATHVEDVSPAEMRKRTKAAAKQMAAGGGM